MRRRFAGIAARTWVPSPGASSRPCGASKAGTPSSCWTKLDKVGADFRGDPASALLEVLDPAQNNSFTDHYLDLPFDLSRVLFITTANWLEPVHPALRDRLEVIELPSYTESEKLQIAKRYLLPRQLEEHGLTKKEVRIPDATLRRVIHDYTREAGVRQLEREIAALSRKATRRIVSNGHIGKPLVLAPDVPAGLPGRGEVRQRNRGDHQRVRHRHWAGLDAGGGRNPLYRSDADAGQRQFAADRFTGRGDERERADRGELFAQPGRDRSALTSPITPSTTSIFTCRRARRRRTGPALA